MPVTMDAPIVALASAPEPAPSVPQANAAGAPIGPWADVIRDLTLDGALGDALPVTFRIGMLPHPKLRLRAPIEVTVGRDDDLVTVWSEALDEVGYGTHLTAAVEDFQRTIVELYWELNANAARLGPAMADVWTALGLLVEERE